MWENIIQKLKTLIGEIDGIYEIFTYEAEKFNGSPSCTITPAENESDYSTNEENTRIYAFNIRLFVNRENAPSGQVSEIWADKLLRGLCDEILNKLDKNYSLSGIENTTGNTFINLAATPSVWGYSLREQEYRSCEINVRARVRVDVNLI